MKETNKKETKVEVENEVPETKETEQKPKESKQEYFVPDKGTTVKL